MQIESVSLLVNFMNQLLVCLPNCNCEAVCLFEWNDIWHIVSLLQVNMSSGLWKFRIVLIILLCVSVYLEEFIPYFLCMCVSSCL